MTIFKLPNIGLEAAQEGNTDAARLQIERLIEIIRLSPDADDDEKEYFIKAFVEVACAYDKKTSLPKTQAAIMSALGLNRRRGGQRNDISKDFEVVLRIDEVMQVDGIGVEPAIKKLLQLNDPVLCNVPNTDFENLKRLYYSLLEVLHIRKETFQEMMDSTVIPIRVIN